MGLSLIDLLTNRKALLRLSKLKMQTRMLEDVSILSSMTQVLPQQPTHTHTALVNIFVPSPLWDSRRHFVFIFLNLSF